MTTAYDAVTTRIADPVVDVILVGHSVGNVCLGFDDHFTGQHGDVNHHLDVVARKGPAPSL